MTTVDERTTGAGFTPAPAGRTETTILARLTAAEYRARVLGSLSAPISGPLWQAMTSDRLRLRTRNVLIAAAIRVQQQLDRADAGEPMPAGWLERALAFQTHVARRQSELGDARTDRRTQPATGLDPVRRLATAIAVHRAVSQAAGFDPEPYDIDLWTVLDELEA
jgi:hypothetical protein